VRRGRTDNLMAEIVCCNVADAATDRVDDLLARC